LLGSAASGAGRAAGVRCVARDTDRFAGRRIEAVPKVQAEGFVLGFVGACQGRARRGDARRYNELRSNLKARGALTKINSYFKKAPSLPLNIKGACAGRVGKRMRLQNPFRLNQKAVAILALAGRRTFLEQHGEIE
jgi:hypothetical protein